MAKKSTRLLKRKARDAVPKSKGISWGMQTIDTLTANENGHVTVPALLLYGMEALIDTAAQPVAAIEIDPRAGEVRLLCASRMALELLDARNNLNLNNRYLAEFLGHCQSLHQRPSREIHWKSATGTIFSARCRTLPAKR